jgi:hypothetical protein
MLRVIREGLPRSHISLKGDRPDSVNFSLLPGKLPSQLLRADVPMTDPN